MTMKNLIENWKFPDRSAEKVQISLRIPVTDHARLHALKEVYPRRSVNDILSDIIRVGLDEIVDSLPSRPANEDDVIDWHQEHGHLNIGDFGLAIGDRVGPAVDYKFAYNRIMSAKATGESQEISS